MVFAQAPELADGQPGSFLLLIDEFVHEEGLKAEFGPVVLPTRIFSDLVEERQYEGPGGARRSRSPRHSTPGKHSECSVSTDVKY